MKKVIIILLIVIGITICSILIFNTNVEVEYVPETEIEDVDLRKTMVCLYFANKESGELQKESRLIDSKDLLIDPYSELIDMLIDGPESEFLKKTIPEGTRLLNVELVGECLNVNLSKEFIDNCSDDPKDKENAANSILYTVKELTEVCAVKIMVEGEELK